jgi:hypothetical protein
LSDIKRIESRACCGKTQTTLQLGFALDAAHIPIFTASGFILSKSYIDRGILYIEDKNISAMGPIGSNRLQIRCKNTDCIASTDKLEAILKNIV